MMKQALDAVDAIHDAGLDALLWPDALQKIADVFGDIGTAMVFRRDDGSAGFVISLRLAEPHDEYKLRWASHHLRTLRALSRFTHATEVMTNLVTREESETHPFYTRFCLRFGLGWCAGIMVLPHPRNAVWISVQRCISRPEVSAEELEIVGRLGRPRMAGTTGSPRTARPPLHRIHLPNGR